MAAIPPRTRGPKLEPHQVILRPLITEKGTHQFTHRNAYPFEVVVSTWMVRSVAARYARKPPVASLIPSCNIADV